MRRPRSCGTPRVKASVARCSLVFAIIPAPEPALPRAGVPLPGGKVAMQQGHAGAHEGWSSRIVFLMAAVGAAVGLGNLWKFPYTAGVSGGAAFVLVYLLAVGAVAVPIVIAELLIGRRGRMSPPNSFIALARE